MTQQSVQANMLNLLAWTTTRTWRSDRALIQAERTGVEGCVSISFHMHTVLLNCDQDLSLESQAIKGDSEEERNYDRLE